MNEENTINNKKSANTWVFDIETIANFFSYIAINCITDEVKKFVIWEKQNDIEELLQHLDEAKGLVGFNSLSFDYPVLHQILKYRNKYLKNKDGERIARNIYQIAQNTIEKEWSEVRDPLIPQLDLFRIHHFDNKARMTSLKKLEIALQMKNVKDMPHPHDKDVTTQEEADAILAYNLIDVQATKIFLDKTKEKIKLRKGLKKRYGLDCLNYSDSKIGEQLMLMLYCQKTGMDAGFIKKLRTYRRLFKFNECIPSYINFSTPEFSSLLNYLKSIEVNELKDSFKYSFEYHDFIFDLGTGGMKVRPLCR